MKKTIKGGIQFELTMDGDNWDLSYTQSSENDLAVMAISRQIMEYSEEVFEDLVKSGTLDTKAKRHYKALIEKTRAAKFGLAIMTKYLRDII